MGTGVIALCGAGLPVRVAGLHLLDLATWALASLTLIALLTVTAAHHARRPEVARTYLLDRVHGPFYGTLPMALLVVGAGTVLVGANVVGQRVAVGLDWVLWGVGTVLGVATLVGVPLVHARHGVRPDRGFAGRLLPVVAPMVSAATGALLVPHAEGALAPAMLIACYGCFVLATLATVAVVTGMVRAGAPPSAPALAPVRWVVLGPLGDGAVAFGVPVLVLAAAWMALSLVATAGSVRAGLPFGLPWWSFTFPVGMVVLGCERMATRTGLAAFRDGAVVVFVALVAVWAMVAVRTLHALVTGRLTASPA